MFMFILFCLSSGISTDAPSNLEIVTASESITESTIVFTSTEAVTITTETASPTPFNNSNDGDVTTTQSPNSDTNLSNNRNSSILIDSNENDKIKNVHDVERVAMNVVTISPIIESNSDTKSNVSNEKSLDVASHNDLVEMSRGRALNLTNAEKTAEILYVTAPPSAGTQRSASMIMLKAKAMSDLSDVSMEDDMDAERDNVKSNERTDSMPIQPECQSKVSTNL